MDLLCAERLADCRLAERDRVIFEDMRVLQNLLDLETSYIPTCNYFGTVQKDIQPFMRKVVSTWMLEVCEDQHCEDQVFPLAVNFLDRFLCACAISRRQLQLLAAVCLLLASKIRQGRSLSVDHLCFYTDHSISPDDMRNWELLVLSKLKWAVTAVTGFDYVDHVLERVEWSKESPLIRRHAHILVGLCYTEPEFIQSRPSVLAAASIGAAVRGLNPPSAASALTSVCALTHVDPAAAEHVLCHIESVVASESASLQTLPTANNNKVTSSASCSSKLMCVADETGQPETPTDVQDVHF
ncbi:G1/S-specific cyclin-D2 [Cryptotermes secundus]|uniref:G1/S-specific cyclin-D2 n=1 Tax=Cryptotermes secundus TaxID=105785 RepID=UPI000CD7B70B|nr:G1/S-specific cyclin-D2 [Cryptotermes secundus]